MLEAFYLERKVREMNTIDLPRYAVYMSPGWQDFGSAIRDMVGEIKVKPAVYLLGSTGYQHVAKYCDDMHHEFRHINHVPSMWALGTVIKPVCLFAYDKAKGAVYRYAKDAYETHRVVPRLILKLKLQREN